MIFLMLLVLLSHLALTVYFGWRFWLHRRLPSLLCAILPIGWALFIAQSAGWLADYVTRGLFSISLVVGVFGVMTIVVFETKQENPFR